MLEQRAMNVNQNQVTLRARRAIVEVLVRVVVETIEMVRVRHARDKEAVASRNNKG